MVAKRTEFGAERNHCACKFCVTNCKFMPGFLIPADLSRMIRHYSLSPIEILPWAEENLLASPGALVMKAGVTFRIPTLVPAVKPDGSCIHLRGKSCDIYQIAPFGCAFFSCSHGDEKLSALGLMEILRDREERGPYTYVWDHLNKSGLRQVRAEELRERMRKAEECFHTS